MAFTNQFGTINQALNTFYTCPVGFEAVVHSVFISPNVANTLITLGVQNVALAFGPIVKDVPLIYGGTLYFPKPVNLAAGESIQASCSLNADAEIFLSILEQAVV